MPGWIKGRKIWPGPAGVTNPVCVITWGKSVEDAYFKMEITDAYCRTIIHAQSLPGGSAIPAEGMAELLKLKQITVIHQYTDGEALQPDFTARAIQDCRAMRPFLDYLLPIQ